MKSFEFSLNRIRNYKSQVLDKEKKTLGLLQRKRDEILEKIDNNTDYRLDKAAELSKKQCEGLSMTEISAYNYLIENARLQAELLQVQLLRAEEEFEAQRQIVLGVYQEKTGMDKLEEKQAEEYRLLEAKATENEIMQVVSTQMADKSKNGIDSDIA
ncbi:MAG: flagellar FliJ family protein [Oscillospiraceae bacterium]